VKALIAYGTGRGTTGQVAEAIAQGMSEKGVDAVAMSLEYLALAPGRVASSDIIGIGSPVHFYREARYVSDFLATLPRLDGRSAFVFCTFGMNRIGETLHRLHRTLLERGLSVCGAESFRSGMSYFPLLKRGMGNSDDLPDSEVLEGARQFGMRMARLPELEPIQLDGVSTLTRVKASLLADLRVRKRVFPGIRINTSTCTGYGSCLSRCLVKGLDRQQGESIPYVTDSCVHCLECIAWCPQGAIETDSGLKEWMATLSYRLGIH
jgi:NAD-dependent dihydropyrimidine dehydrogenase PreA subunit/flavodoxin